MSNFLFESQSSASSSSALTVVSITSANSPYSASISTFIKADASGGAITVNLPAASGNGGKTIVIMKSDNAFTNAVTIDGNGAETINGATTKVLRFPSETITLLCDGSNWFIEDRFIPKTWFSFTPTGTWVTNTTYTGLFSHLSGNVVRFQFKATVSGAPTSTQLIFTLPNSWNLDETSVLLGSDASFAEVTTLMATGFAIDQSASQRFMLTTRYVGTTTQIPIVVLSQGASDVDVRSVDQATPFTFANGDDVTFWVDVPILEIDQV